MSNVYSLASSIAHIITANRIIQPTAVNIFAVRSDMLTFLYNPPLFTFLSSTLLTPFELFTRQIFPHIDSAGDKYNKAFNYIEHIGVNR